VTVFDLPEILLAERAGRALFRAVRDAPALEAVVAPTLAGAAALGAVRHAANRGRPVQVTLLDPNVDASETFAGFVETIGCMDLPLRQGSGGPEPLPGARRIDGAGQGGRTGGTDAVRAEAFLDAGPDLWDGYARTDAAGPNPFLSDAREADALGTAEVREIDRAAIEDYGLPGLLLMENAGIGAAVTAAEMLAAARGEGPVVVLAGGGNNGGDGFVVARGLVERGGAVRVLLLGDPLRVKGDARTNLEILSQREGLVEQAPESMSGLTEALRGARLVVDAIFGTGLDRPVEGAPAAAIGAMNAAEAPVLALDLPSGIHGDTGAVLGAAVRAEATVTFARPKRGLFRGEGPRHTGRVVLADIGDPRAD
jgi:hydroxyethylthiazole kinase-like uncharacterized protein yjeF